MSVVEELGAQFEALNIKIDSKVLQKCADLCLTYNIDSEDFIDQWLAYSASNLNGEVPSLDELDKLERKELKKQNNPSFSTPQSNRTIVETTPMRTPVRKNLSTQYIESPKVNTDLMEIDIQSQTFAKRSDAGAVVQTFGKCDDTSFKSISRTQLNVKVLNQTQEEDKYMFEKFLSKRACFDKISKLVINQIAKEFNLELTSFKDIQQFSSEATICGRICVAPNEKLNLTTVELEGLASSNKNSIKLSLKKVPKVRLFTGQSVVVTGQNMREWFIVDKIYTGASLPPPVQINESFQIITAAGPFTLDENLLYEPLDQLLKLVIETKPNLLILMGPFIEKTHPHIVADILCESYDSFFENMVDGIMQRLKGLPIQVVFVPSHRDVHHHVVFPTLPFKLKKKYKNAIFAPDPFILDVEGVVISGSTADILRHLSKTEFCIGDFMDRVAHLTSHIFNQRCFYPLHPPDTEVNVDYQLVSKYGMLETTPHVMILPSSLRYFVKMIDGCVVVNPEKLIKNSFAGTFAKIEIEGSSGQIKCVIQRI